MTKINGRCSGRPKAEPEKLRKVRPFRASDEEWASYEKKAAAYGYSTVPAWIRAVLDVVAPEPDPAPETTNEAS